MNAVSNHMLKGKRIDPKIAEPRPGEEAILKVFVGGIDTTMADEDLKTYFEKFGPVSVIDRNSKVSAESKSDKGFFSLNLAHSSDIPG